jgi:hypothetical protein
LPLITVSTPPLVPMRRAWRVAKRPPEVSIGAAMECAFIINLLYRTVSIIVATGFAVQ